MGRHRLVKHSLTKQALHISLCKHWSCESNPLPCPISWPLLMGSHTGPHLHLLVLLKSCQVEGAQCLTKREDQTHFRGQGAYLLFKETGTFSFVRFPAVAEERRQPGDTLTIETTPSKLPQVDSRLRLSDVLQWHLVSLKAVVMYKTQTTIKWVPCFLIGTHLAWRHFLWRSPQTMRLQGRAATALPRARQCYFLDKLQQHKQALATSN